ncbi:uncharacterized protein BDR25DRAFT_381792 [Lindgomyces ingoldianus]|uniref:Uncharacterized protein n=1 Tax=Lindgomyces ingoldianus TaxID=673940 RepID=A0ACB6QAX9_9PLEO|nr:uncharacterized protein BDR25DRAFT_381792 [Lindgomyces ingoldianus]KAF2464119.1 hypothetical protein BDR25DRAFT_381792 [Lindgomyces ingoldianus]
MIEVNRSKTVPLVPCPSYDTAQPSTRLRLDQLPTSYIMQVLSPRICRYSCMRSLTLSTAFVDCPEPAILIRFLRVIFEYSLFVER